MLARHLCDCASVLVFKLAAFAWLLLLLSPAVAQPESKCLGLELQRAALKSIAEDLARDGLSDSAVQNLLGFRDSFQATVRRSGLAADLESIAVGTGASVVASLAAGGPPGWGAAALGAVLGLGYTKATDFLTHFSAWRQTDANTAFYQFVLDYAEYGRVGAISDDLALFATKGARLLEAVTGAPPPADRDALSLYLQAHGAELLFFFGVFEEKLGSQAFPRLKFPDAVGRFGPSRLSAGYYRKVLGHQVGEDLKRLDHELEELLGNDCRVAAVTPECAPPAPGQTSTCTCDVAAPTGTVWGSDLYTNDSLACTAAIHAGVVRPTAFPDGSIHFVGVTQIAGAAGCPYFKGSAAFGVTSQDYGNWHATFYFPSVQRGLCDETSAPASGIWYCPATLPGEVRSLTCHCTPKAAESGSVWGTRYYTNDSSICRAARHAGAIGAHGGSVRVLLLNGLDNYEGSERNGVSTSGFGAWGASIGFP